jgi:predicted DNA-binding protein
MNLNKYILNQLREAYSPLPNQDEIDAELDKINRDGMNPNHKSKLDRLVSGNKKTTVDVPKDMEERLKWLRANTGEVKSKPFQVGSDVGVKYVNDRGRTVVFTSTNSLKRGDGAYEFLIVEDYWDFIQQNLNLSDEDVRTIVQLWLELDYNENVVSVDKINNP